MTRGLHRGTIAGVYADTGIFYSTDPDTVYRSWESNLPAGCPVQMVNNRGETITPITRWDAASLLARGHDYEEEITWLFR